MVDRRLQLMIRRDVKLSERGGVGVEVPLEDDVKLLQEAVDENLLVFDAHPGQGAAEPGDGVAHEDVVSEELVACRHELALSFLQLEFPLHGAGGEEVAQHVVVAGEVPLLDVLQPGRTCSSQVGRAPAILFRASYKLVRSWIINCLYIRQVLTC
jgi:hypothetical protein